jgi:tetratricopeptide (TPR) repeat protein
MEHILKAIVSSSLLFLLVSFRAEVCKAQVPEGYSLPASDTTSVPASPTPDAAPQKKKHHKNINPPVTDSSTLSTTGTTNPDSSMAVTKPAKKKHRYQKSDSTSMDTSSLSAKGTNKSDSSAAPTKPLRKRHYKKIENTPADSLSVSTSGTNMPDSSVTIPKKSRKKKYNDLMSDSLQRNTSESHETNTDAHADPVAESYTPRTPDDEAAAIVETGNKLQGNGDFRTAMTMFDSVINYYPKTFYYKYAFYYRGQANALADKKEDALKDLSTFITLDSCQSPYCSDAHYNRALVYLHQSDFNPAINDFNFVASHDSTYKNLKYVYFYRAFCYGEQNVFPKAVQDLTKFLFIDNMKTAASADALDSRAFYKIRLNDNRGAVQDYDEAATLYLAIIQSDKNAKEEGYINKLIDTYTQRGLAKAGINKWDEAILDYNLAIKYDPNYAKAYLLRGLAYINQSKQDLGCLDLSKAGELGATEAYDEIKKYCK